METSKCIICEKEVKEKSRIYGMSCHSGCVAGKKDAEIRNLVRNLVEKKCIKISK